jgi:hypothetical protein
LLGIAKIATALEDERRREEHDLGDHIAVPLLRLVSRFV